MMNIIHEIARERFRLNPVKCLQRHIREVYMEMEPHPQVANLYGAEVVPISRREASQIILKYEFLGTMGFAPSAFYGLKYNGELLGAVCFSVAASPAAKNIC